MISRRLLLTGTAGALLLTACTGDVPNPGPAPSGTEPPEVDARRHQVVSRTPPGDLVIPLGDEDALAASRALLAAATAVVVVDPPREPTPSPTGSPGGSATPTATATATPASPTPTASGTPGTSTASPSPTPTVVDRGPDAARAAEALGIPLFVTGPGLLAELDRLQTRTVISYAESPDVGDREVVEGTDDPAELRVEGLPVAAEGPDALVLASAEPSPALAATLAAAGLSLTLLDQAHPGATTESYTAVREHEGPVVALGEAFGEQATFAAALAATRTHPELPGGGIVPLPKHRMIALYGHPDGPALGMMGEQPPAEAVERVQALVAEYAELRPEETFLGAFEIITTVASASAGEDGDYSYETPIETILPWIEAAEENNLYVVLDLQPGRTAFIDQAKLYADLLKRPYVGLALDPEWRLKPNERHLRQIGQVHVDEVNEVAAWLAGFIRENELPPKVLTLHQFQTRMIVDRVNLDTSHPEIQFLMHVDGQGGQSAKQNTWSVLKRDLPEGVALGWKNFEDEDIPMLTPRQTVEQVEPLPHFISYQ